MRIILKNGYISIEIQNRKTWIQKKKLNRFKLKYILIIVHIIFYVSGIKFE